MTKTTTEIVRPGQTICSPLDYGFQWTEDWYRWDPKPAEKAALKARNDIARAARKAGYRVTTFSLGRQLRSMGGIGSGHPHIELVTTGYGVNIG
jgi:hypothetical protein